MFTIMGIEFKKFIRSKKFLVAMGLMIANCTLCLMLTAFLMPKRVGVQNGIKARKKYINKLEEQGNLKKYKGASSSVNSAYEKILREEKAFLKVMEMHADKSIPWQQKLHEDIKFSQDNLKRNPYLHPSAKHSELSNIRIKRYYLENNIPYDYDENITSFSTFPDELRLLGVFGLLIMVGIMVSHVVSGENKPPTIKFLLTKPVKRWKVILSKFIVVVVTVNVVILIIEFINFLLIGVLFSFGDPSIPVLVDVKYRIVDAAHIAEVRGAVVPYVGSGTLISTGSLIVRMLIIQTLGVTASIAFCFLLSTIIENTSVSLTLSLIFIGFTHAIINLKTYTIERLKPATVLDKLLIFLFPTYHDSLDIITGKMNDYLSVDFITFKFSIILLLVWIVVCYGISHLVFVRKDIVV
ncbi:ABC transporter permease subunit [Haloimpatiens massiliensis]|uniref:ABC transporter permease subunit n=1 Tax=Haloimpatiens massiliensis TaxID=1658110 RepID=UPI000C85F43E|nr:ABC transporter permease subunit [Haloimpatiens massiliensis]